MIERFQIPLFLNFFITLLMDPNMDPPKISSKSLVTRWKKNPDRMMTYTFRSRVILHPPFVAVDKILFEDLKKSRFLLLLLFRCSSSVLIKGFSSDSLDWPIILSLPHPSRTNKLDDLIPNELDSGTVYVVS